MNQKLLIIATAVLAAGTASAAAPNSVYSVTVPGHNGPMTVDTHIENGKITDIITRDLESPGIGKIAIRKLHDEIVFRKNIPVEAISGATITCAAYLDAVGQTIKMAGVDPAKYHHPKKAAPLKDSYRSDVVIVGGGGAGLAAAAAAIEAGARVIIVEKLGMLGGSSAVSGGSLNAVDPARQKLQGIPDSVERHYNDTMRGGHNKNNPYLARYLVENALPTLRWLEDKGVMFQPKVHMIVGGLYPRGHSVIGRGSGYISAFERFIAAYPDRVQVFTNTKAVSLVKNQNGRVTGVSCTHKGKPVTFSADRGVIITTGGFAANIQMRMKYNTGDWKDVKLDGNIGTTNRSNASLGEGLALGTGAGAGLVDMNEIQLHPGGAPGTGIMSSWPSGSNRIFVNKRGSRFVSENAPRDVLCRAILKQPGSTYFVVLNHLRFPTLETRAGDTTLRDQIKLGQAYEGKTLEELAQKIGADPAKLQASVDEYNAVVTHKKAADQFGFKGQGPSDKPLLDGPWYATRLVPAVHHTMGGLRINVNSQVLTPEGRLIPGLYAAGEVTGGVHGANRVGGNGILDAMVFGRHAGAMAAQNK